MNTLRANIRARVGSFQLEVEFETSSLLIVRGDNGSGKSTLLKSLLGLLREVEGTLELGSTRLLETSRQLNVPSEERRIGYLPQSRGLFPHLTVRENLAFVLRSFRSEWTRTERDTRVEEILRSYQLDQLAGRLPGTLSGGEAQRVALARAIVVRPAALFLDEPFAAMHGQAQEAFGEAIIEHLSRYEIPVLLVHHGALPASLGTRAELVLESGRIRPGLPRH